MAPSFKLPLPPVARAGILLAARTALGKRAAVDGASAVADSFALNVLELAAKVLTGTASVDERARVRRWSAELAPTEEERFAHAYDVFVGFAHLVRARPGEAERRAVARDFAAAIGARKRLKDDELDRLVELLAQYREGRAKRGGRGKAAAQRTAYAVLVDVLLLLGLAAEDPSRPGDGPLDRKNFATRLQRMRART